ncbi:MAG: hypothetical protein ACFE88_12695 [Candidatus Hermodarchaeota archaeon]
MIFQFYILDGYTLGTYNVIIWARGLDGKEVEIQSVFTVYLEKKKLPITYKTELIISSILIGTLVGIPSVILIGSSRYLQKSKTNFHKKKDFKKKKVN